jgi:hypothetical protein
MEKKILLNSLEIPSAFCEFPNILRKLRSLLDMTRLDDQELRFNCGQVKYIFIFPEISSVSRTVDAWGCFGGNEATTARS